MKQQNLFPEKTAFKATYVGGEKILSGQRRGISTDSSAFPFSQREKKSTMRQ